MQGMGLKVVVCQLLGSICSSLLELNFLLTMRLRCARDALQFFCCTLNHFVTLAHNISHAKSKPDWMQGEWCSGSIFA
jgi:hypothetical protein